MTKSLGDRLGVLLAVLALATGCLAVSSESVVFVRSGAPADQRKQVAKAYVTDGNLARLRTRLKERFPAATGDQLQGLYLKWNVKPGDGETAAAIIVGIQGQGLDGGEFLRVAGELVETDINGPSKQQ